MLGTAISLKAEELFHITSFPVTNSLILTGIASAVLLSSAFLIRRRFAFVPRGAQNAAELFVETWLGLMTPMIGDRNRAERYFPLVATIFLFILVSNWLGILPGIGSLVFIHEHESIPLLRPPAADLNFTLALAIITVVLTNAFGIAAQGAARYSKKFFNFQNPITATVGLLELLSEFVRILSFSFRLFGNIFAGEVILVVITSLLPYLAPVPFMLIETFVGFIQAFIFAMLATMFIGMATGADEH